MHFSCNLSALLQYGAGFTIKRACKQHSNRAREAVVQCLSLRSQLQHKIPFCSKSTAHSQSTYRDDIDAQKPSVTATRLVGPFDDLGFNEDGEDVFDQRRY
jgi:hypothetical protein